MPEQQIVGGQALGEQDARVTAPKNTYALGHSEHEAQRLASQGALFEDLTADLLRRAGLQQGMRVVDLGCGVGDVSLLAARLVGPSGTVLAVDRASPLLQIARQRAASAGIHNIRFEEADLNVLMLENDVDAIVGRTILAHLPKPAAVLQRLKGSLRPSGIVVIQEADVEPFSQIPASALFSRAKGWISEALRAAGVELNMGSRLCGTFLQAGLPRPSLIAGARVESGPLSPCYRYVADIVRSLLPLIEQTGVATAEQVDIETLTDRLREEAIAHECVTFLPRLVGAWVQISARG